MIPTRRFQTRMNLLRHNLACLCSLLKTECEDGDEDLELLRTLQERAEGVLAEGELPSWAGLRSVLVSDLKVCGEFLQEPR